MRLLDLFLPVSRLDTGWVVGVLIAGIILGPHVLDIFGKERPVADFMSQMGILLLMFLAGLEVDLSLFRRPSTEWSRLA